MLKSLIGKKSGKLKVISFHGYRTLGKNGNRYPTWKCQCDCGKRVIIEHHQIANKRYKSCGCARFKNRKRLFPTKRYGILFSRVRDAYIANANRRGRAWTISNKRFNELINSKCFYCGAEPSNLLRKKRRKKKVNIFMFIRYNGIDRLDNRYGYTKKNCVACCKNCNFLKKKLSYDEFMGTIRRIYEYQEAKNIQPERKLVENCTSIAE